MVVAVPVVVVLPEVVAVDGRLSLERSNSLSEVYEMAPPATAAKAFPMGGGRLKLSGRMVAFMEEFNVVVVVVVVVVAAAPAPAVVGGVADEAVAPSAERAACSGYGGDGDGGGGQRSRCIRIEGEK